MTDFRLTALPRFDRRLALLVLILLLGWALRLADLDGRSLWEDEGWTMLLSQGPGLDDVTRTMAADQHPPLYFVLFRLWRNAAGDSEFAGRYLGVLFGMLAVAGMAQLGRTLFSPAAGLLAALVVALADLHIDLSQEIRHYGLLATFTVYSSLFYVRWWRRPTRPNRIGYVLCSLGLIYTHYLGAFVLLAQAIHLVLLARPRRRLVEGILLLGLVGLGFLPWLPVVIDQNSLRWDNPLYYQNALPNSLATFRAVRTALLGHYFALLTGLALLGLVALSYGRRVTVRLRPLWPVLYLALWIGLMAGLTVLINERRQFLTVRNFVVILPALAVLVARGMTNIERTARLFLVGLLVVVGVTTVDARRHYPDWRAVVRHVTDYHLDGEPVLMDVWVGDFPARYYVTRQMGSAAPFVSLREWRDDYGTLFLPTLLGYLHNQDAFWLIYWGDRPMDEYGSLIADAGFQRTAAFSVDHLGTPLYSYRYDRLVGEPLAIFGDLFALHKFSVPASASAGDSLTVGLWWTALRVPPLDYSISVFLLDAGGVLVAQHDGPPLDGASPTRGWQPGDLKYDRPGITLPASLAPGDYTLGVKIYWYGDNQPLPARAGDAPAADFLRLAAVELRP